MHSRKWQNLIDVFSHLDSYSATWLPSFAAAASCSYLASWLSVLTAFACPSCSAPPPLPSFLLLIIIISPVLRSLCNAPFMKNHAISPS
ncbi:hypothetical protein SCHPADRAFT_907397 [Schizopora paradoxa]|uniref:Uncharacterized protein n=1 Tax=Schizopora paradoxa TaxID=27342 RepID=A0A0H2RDK2_9AGAM|nr:hypothetical protein SCHPADRAFT_907397 [Schizopora paradoxa]